MVNAHRLTTVLEPRGPAAAVILSDEVVAALGGGAKAFPVKLTVNGGHTFEGRVARMGGESLIRFNEAVRTAAGVSAGETIDVEVVAETGERTVETPPPEPRRSSWSSPPTARTTSSTTSSPPSRPPPPGEPWASFATL